jgi:hypothetical protein
MREGMTARLLFMLSALALAGCGGDESGSGTGNGEQQTTPPPSTTTSAQPGEQGTPLVASPLGTLAYRPTTIEGESGGGILNIQWRRYGGQTAVGTGVTSDGSRVTIRLRGIFDCDGRPTYLRWSVQLSGRTTKPEFSPIMSPHEWNETCYPEPEPEDYPSSVGED